MLQMKLPGDPPVIAIIGAGEMGAAVGRRLREAGARVLTSLDGRSPASVDRVRRAGLEVVDDDQRLTDGIDCILSIVPPAAALEVAGRLCTPLRHAASPPPFADCNAIAPTTMRRIEGLLDPLPVIDAGIIGGPPIPDSQDPSAGPRVYTSGPHAHRLAILTRYGLDIAVMDAPIGAASGLKLAYAGLTKGFTALAAAIVTAASRDGLAEALRIELARSQPQFLDRIDRFVPAMFTKAYRWVAEMEQIAEFISDPAAGATIYEGAARLYEMIAADLADGQPHDRFANLTRFRPPSSLKPHSS
jgi:3-hydroxyisobutyrate dehydrogenase-like beta-hydroxyacid dehydrogenase